MINRMLRFWGSPLPYVNVIAYLLSPLLERAGRSVLKPINLPKSVREQECSAMDPGEVWALYNSHERPNWYALIVSRTGDRFVQNPDRKKSPIRIEVRFLEMTDAYADLENDEWDTLSGTGLYRVRDVTDNQNSWVAFSHRMDTFLKYDDLYFIYPSKDEVWAVCDNKAHTRYLVFVIDSYIDKNKAKQGKPGKECFRARCRLLQKVETELYRVQDKEIDYTELSSFAFRAPYIYKNESNFLKIELTSRQRNARPDYFHKQEKKRRKSSDPSSSSSSDGEADEVAADEVALAEIMRGDDAAGLENCLDSSSSPLSNGFIYNNGHRSNRSGAHAVVPLDSDSAVWTLHGESIPPVRQRRLIVNSSQRAMRRKTRAATTLDKRQLYESVMSTLLGEEETRSPSLEKLSCPAGHDDGDVNGSPAVDITVISSSALALLEQTELGLSRATELEQAGLKGHRAESHEWKQVGRNGRGAESHE